MYQGFIKIYTLKKIRIIILVFTLSLISCSKDDSVDQSDCSNTFNLLVDKDWFPPVESADFLAVLRFDSNGNYSEDEVYAGSWEFEDGCNSIHFFVVESGELEFQYEIILISSDSFKIKDPFGAIITYHTISYLIS